MTNWVERIIALVGGCIRARFTGVLEVRLSFRDGGIRTMHAECKKVTRQG